MSEREPWHGACEEIGNGIGGGVRLEGENGEWGGRKEKICAWNRNKMCDILVVLSVHKVKGLLKTRSYMDRKEYEQITTLYLDSVYRVALSGCGNKSDAEDVVQNTFTKLWEREEAFEDEDLLIFY